MLPSWAIRQLSDSPKNPPPKKPAALHQPRHVHTHGLWTEPSALAALPQQWRCSPFHTGGPLEAVPRRVAGAPLSAHSPAAFDHSTAPAANNLPQHPACCTEEQETHTRAEGVMPGWSWGEALPAASSLYPQDVPQHCCMSRKSTSPLLPPGSASQWWKLPA